jgi:EpsI family protein
VNNSTLTEKLTHLGPWQNAGDITLAQSVIGELKLDDFIFRNFSNGRETLSLYIGYYNSSKKVGAAHDPLVCFPGQGWVLHDIRQDTLPVMLGGQEVQLHYSTMLAERDSQRQMLVYWFQADDQATSGVLAQKISLLRSKILGGSGANAFVRISIAMEDRSRDECLTILTSFIRDFYPAFTKYILTSVPKGEAE